MTRFCRLFTTYPRLFVESVENHFNVGSEYGFGPSLCDSSISALSLIERFHPRLRVEIDGASDRLDIFWIGATSLVNMVRGTRRNRTSVCRILEKLETQWKRFQSCSNRLSKFSDFFCIITSYDVDVRRCFSYCCIMLLCTSHDIYSFYLNNSESSDRLRIRMRIQE